MEMRQLKKKPLHIILPTIFSVAVAIISFLVVFGIKDGITRQLDGMAEMYGLGTKRVVLRQGGQRVSPTITQYQKLKEIPEFKAVAGETIGWLTAPKVEQYRFRGLGVTGDFFKIRRFSLAEGRYFTAEEIESGKPVAVIGASISKALFPEGNAFGQVITHYGLDYTIVGVLQEIQVERAFEEQANTTFYCPYTATSNIPVGSRLSQLWVDTALDVEVTRNLIMEKRIFSPSIQVDVLAQEDIWASFYQVKSQILALLIAISLVVLILAGVNVMMVSLSSVNQRLYEIGVKKAVGAGGERIFLEIIQETMLLYLFGGFLGVAGFSALSAPLSSLIGEELVINWRVVGMGLMMVCTIGFLTSLYPAYLGAKLTPLQALYRRGNLVSRLKKDVSRRVFVVVGIVISIIAITIISMVSGGYLKQIEDLAGIFTDDLLYIKADVALNTDFKQAPDVTYPLYEKLRDGLHGIKAITYANIRYETDVMVNGEMYGITVMDVEEEFLEMMNLSLAEGQTFDDYNQLVIGAKVQEYFQSMGVQEYWIDGAAHKVSGVLKKIPTEVGGKRQFDYGHYIYRKADPENYSSMLFSHQIIIRAANPANLDKLIIEINRIAKELYPDKGDVSIIRPIVANESYRQQLLIVRKVCLIYAVIGLMISGIGVMNLMLVNVGARAKEIGIRRAVGASRAAIMQMLLNETVILTGIGGLLGIVGGIISAYYLAEYFSMEFYFSPLLLIPAIAFSLATGIITGLFPAYRASKLEPVAILKPIGE